MRTLYLDFGSHHKTVAIVDGNTVATSTLENRTEEAIILKTITSLTDLDSIARIALVTGPGGFMSLRSAFSVGNALAWSSKITIGGIHLSDVKLAQLPKKTDAIWVHSTKKDLLFVRGKGDAEASVMTPDALLKKLGKKKPVFVGELIPAQAELLGIMPAADLQPIEHVLPSIVDGMTYAEPPLLPWYGRGI